VVLATVVASRVPAVPTAMHRVGGTGIARHRSLLVRGAPAQVPGPGSVHGTLIARDGTITAVTM